MHAEHPDMLAAALAAYDAGLCVIRASTDGSKRPFGKWKRYQTERPTRDEVEQWFTGGHPGMGVVCGAVSGDLEMFELEGRFCAEGGTKSFATAMRVAGLELLLKRLANGFHTISPSEGRHFLYRVAGAVDGNTKLARRPATPEELAENPDDAVKTLIETRGEGGFVVLAPSHGAVHPTGRPWRQRAGAFDAIPTITVDQRDALFAVARSFDQEVERPEPIVAEPARRTIAPRWSGGTAGASWMDAVAEHLRQAAPVQTLLERHGWEYCYTDGHGRQLMRRPGKDQGVSASINANGRLHPFSTSVPFRVGGKPAPTYDELDVLAAYEYGGDRQAAGRAIAEQTGILGAWKAAPPRPAVDHRTGEIVAPAAADGALDEAFWTARPWLAHIRQAARARLVAPTALLGAVLARVAAFTPPSTCLPALVGGNAPLSLLVALRGGSGAGKSSTVAAAGELIPHTPAGCVGPLALGSGEGLVEAFMELVEEEGSDGKKRKVKRQARHGALFSLDEGQALNEIGSRRGSTILPILRTAWSGGDPGQANASVETFRHLAPGSYHVGLISLWQDHVAAALLADEAGGTPQRFIWLPTDDPGASADTPAWPGELDWEAPALIGHGAKVLPNPLEVACEIRHEVLEARVQRLRTGADGGLDAHRLLAKLKVAGCLTVLDGRVRIGPDDWALAEVIMRVSDGVRSWILAEAQRAVAEAEARGHQRAATRELFVAATARDKALLSAARSVANKVWSTDGTAISRRDAVSAIGGKYKKLVSTNEALDEAVRLRWIRPAEEGSLDAGKWLPGDARPA